MVKVAVKNQGELFAEKEWIINWRYEVTGEEWFRFGWCPAFLTIMSCDVRTSVYLVTCFRHYEATPDNLSAMHLYAFVFAPRLPNRGIRPRVLAPLDYLCSSYQVRPTRRLLTSDVPIFACVDC